MASGGLFDLHVNLALQDGWDFYRGSPESFASLFIGVQREVIDEWYDSLVSSNIEFRESWSPNRPSPPTVVIQMQDEPADTQPLGFFAGLGGSVSNPGEDAEVLSLLLQEVVTLTVYAQNPEIMRAVYVMLRAVMVTYSEWFQAVGYRSLEYQGGGDFTVEHGLLPDDTGFYLRQQRWKTISQPCITSIDITTRPLLVAAIDAIVDGEVGGVSTAP